MPLGMQDTQRTICVFVRCTLLTVLVLEACKTPRRVLVETQPFGRNEPAQSLGRPAV